MKTSSCKAKGRRLQQQIRKDLRQIGERYGLEDGDIESRSMGCSGVDLIFSPAATKIFPFSIEAKNQEHLNVVKEFVSHCGKYQAHKMNMLIHSKNHTEIMVTMKWSDFLRVYRRYLKAIER